MKIKTGTLIKMQRTAHSLETKLILVGIYVFEQVKSMNISNIF